MLQPIKLFVIATFICFTGELNLCKANIVIDSVSTTVSTCANNGTATIYASSLPNAFLLYSITSGPVTYQNQNNNTFYSLFPGNYNARLYDINFDSLDVQFTVTGNYQLPDFSPIGIDPTCPGFSDGQITGYTNLNAGLPPFTWQIISPFTSVIQLNDLFTGLGPGNYDIRMTDSCGNFQTRSVTLNSNGTGLADVFGYGGFVPFAKKVGCDSIAVTHYFFLKNDKSQITLTSFTTANGTTIIEDFIATLTGYFDPQIGVYAVTTIIPNMSYGGGSISVSVQDTCGVMVNFPAHDVSPYTFVFGFGAAINQNCVTQMISAGYLDIMPNNFSTYMMEPWHYTLINTSGGLVDSGSCDSNCYAVVFLNPQLPGNSYTFTFTDGCGEVTQQQIVFPPADTAQIGKLAYPGCIDSTAIVEISAVNMGSAYTIELLSGPANAHSTKNHFAYADTIIYPMVFHNQTGLPRFFLKNLPIGVYHFLLYDSCGNYFADSIEVLPTDVSDLDYKFYFQRTCVGSNTLYFGGFNYSAAPFIYTVVSIHNVDSGTFIYSAYNFNFIDSLINLPEGTYAIEVQYSFNSVGNFYPVTPHINDCWIVYDTLTIVPFTNNFFQSQTTITCNGTTYLTLNIDSAQGVAPYQFEIISGPQIFPLQNSNTFVLNQTGTFLIRLTDACGNSVTQQITVDSAAFPPISINGFTCPGSSLQLFGISSPYFNYMWQLPNGNIFIGDTVTINPFSIADTGLYLVSQIVNINGCFDTLYSSYQLSINSAIQQSLNLCAGDTAFVGNNFYTTGGVYVDSLSSVAGCDSVITTTLTFSTNSIDSNYVSICTGDSILVGSNYYSLPGTYVDSVTTANGCKDITYYFLSTNYIYSDTLAATICNGNNFLFGNQSFSATGYYADTIAAANGCDSISVLNLLVQDNPLVTIGASSNYIFEGSNVSLFANTTQILLYNWFGTGITNAITSQNITVLLNSAGWIYLLATDSNGCMITDSVFIEVIENPTNCPNSFIYIPNAFTPNNDGMNDSFKIYGTNIVLNHLEIYSRWGQMIFATNDLNKEWDGIFRDKIKSDIFVYRLTYSGCDDEQKTLEGTLLLIK
jgi:gliding motility-associated-like protein